MELLLGVIVIGIGVLFWIVHRTNVKRREEELRRRREYLIVKFGSAEIADAIVAQKIWQGMIREQLTESWGAASRRRQKGL